jgi:hypothetical protein
MIVAGVRRIMLTLEVWVLFVQVIIGMRRLARQMEDQRRRDQAARRARFGLRMEED